jgi:hypothetical protein
MILMLTLITAYMIVVMNSDSSSDSEGESQCKRRSDNSPKYNNEVTISSNSIIAGPSASSVYIPEEPTENSNVTSSTAPIVCASVSLPLNPDIELNVPTWGQIEKPTPAPTFSAAKGVPQELLDDMDESTPYSLFNCFITDDIIKDITFQTNLYTEQHFQKTGKSYTHTTENEIRTFIGMNLLMGIKPLPCYRDYWSSAPDLHDNYISKLMPVNRFGWLLSNIHINDNTTAAKRGEPNFDKLHKARPFLTTLSEKFKNNFQPNEIMAVDESMIKFKGRSSLKQYMPQKPIKRGYKV